MDVLFHDVSKEGGGHAKKEDCEAESPLCGALGEAYVVCDLLAEDGPAVHGADAAVEQQRGNRSADPLVLNVFPFPFPFT